jgi:hypothetical protein
MDDIQRQLWARVFAAEYERLAKRAAFCFEPESSSYRPGHKQNWQYGCGVDADEIEKRAVERADRAISLLSKRETCVTYVPVD